MNPALLVVLILAFLSVTLYVLRGLIIQRAAREIFADLSGTHMLISDEQDNTFLGFDINNLPFLKPDEAEIFKETPYLQNACINNKDPSKMTPKQQLLEFIQGPCLPTVMIPGIIASRLTVEINCETLKTARPEIFLSCGWNSCADSWDPRVKAPKKSYSLWVSDFSGPLSLLFAGSVACWGNIIQLNRDANEKDMLKRYKSPEGVKISFYNKAPKDQDKCGFAAIQNLIDSSYQVNESRDYYYMKQAFIAMGYQVGLTLYGAPYDWRKTTLTNQLPLSLKESVKQAYKLTGKASVLVGHSLGSQGSLYLLNTLTQEEKDKYVANYVTVTNALTGAPKGLVSYIGGDDEYYYWNRWGVSYYAEEKLLHDSAGAYDVITKDPFTQFAGQPWLKEWESRVKLETEINGATPEGKAEWEKLVSGGKVAYPWFPTPATQCFSGFKYRPNECGLYMYDWSKEPVITIKDKNYTASEKDVKEVLKTYSRLTNLDGLIEDTKASNVHKLENPGVPVTLIYGSHLPTYKKFTFTYDPREFTNKDMYAPINETTMGLGDGTLPIASALLPAFKWAWEFDHKVKGAKPVKAVEICANNNMKGTVYDKKDENAPYQILANEYIGLSCDCQPKEGKTTDGATCNHPAILSDGTLIKFIQNIAYANAKNLNIEQTDGFKLSEEELRELINNCPVVGSDRLNKLSEEEFKLHSS